jgi:CheY-like chemotaxis protein
MLQAQKLESLGVMASGVAHDFNNLLVALIVQNSLALAKLPPEYPARIHVQKSIKAAERAADLTRQMLAYAGHGPSHRQSVDLNELIRENLRLLEVAVPKHVTLSSRLSNHLPSLNADVGQLQQVVMNLILNGAEAIDTTEGTVKVTTETCEITDGSELPWSYLTERPLPGSYVVLSVIDTGAGMDSTTLSRVFDPFFTTKTKGRGLGLAAVLGIVRGHKGALQVESEPGKGAIFHIYLPAEKMPDSQRHSFGNDEVGTGALPSGHVLIIDDEEPVRDAVTDILEMAGVGVLAAADGTSGLALFRERRSEIGLVLLDLSMPGLSGEQTLRGLHKIDPDVCVIVSSGYDFEGVCSRIGPDVQVNFMQKPYNIDTLLETISQTWVAQN